MHKQKYITWRCSEFSDNNIDSLNPDYFIRNIMGLTNIYQTQGKLPGAPGPDPGYTTTGQGR